MSDMMYSPSTGLPDPHYNGEFYADVPVKRLIAWVVDGLIAFLITVAVLPFTAFTGLFFFPFLFMMIGFAYRVVTIAGGSATWGMRLVSIELRDSRGDRFDLGLAFVHTLLYSVFFSTFILQIGSVVLMLTGERAQGLHDHVLGTAAINRPARS